METRNTRLKVGARDKEKRREIRKLDINDELYRRNWKKLKMHI